MSLASLLPKPKYQSQDEFVEYSNLTNSTIQPKKEPPPYGKRANWVPRSLEDFGNGGAFPEIHVSQYPNNMGKKKSQGQSLTLQVDSEGRVKYDAIVKRGHSDDRVIHSKFQDLVPLDIKDDDEEQFKKPDDEEIQKTADKTRASLEEKLQSKIKSTLPKQQVVSQTNEPTYIRYTPSQQNGNFNSGAQSRIIKMVEIPKDPMEPPQFRHKKVPRGPPSPPAPVMHSPPRKVTAKEQNEWKIPPCISNWKNPKGYTIPLDKRLASDGRGLQETYISDGFAKLSGALYEADLQAREAFKLRDQVNKKMEQKKHMVQEEQLKNLAMKAREEKMKALEIQEAEEDTKKAKERDEIRNERRRDIERDLRLSKMSAENRAKVLERNKDRDITEKIALGIAKPTTSQDMIYDQRLFNKSQGMSSGFGDDESYSLYDKPLFQGSSANVVYKPKKDADDEIYGGQDTSKFKQKRDGPVEFEEDPFGMDKFLNETKDSKQSSSDKKSKADDDQPDRQSKRRK